MRLRPVAALLALAACTTSVPDETDTDVVDTGVVDTDDTDVEDTDDTDVEDTDDTDDTDVEDTGDTDVEDTDPPLPLIRGVFESTGSVRTCGGLANWKAEDGFLLRVGMNLCGDDMDALAATVVANLDAAHERGGRAMLALGQGIQLPEAWVAECETWYLDDGRFKGDICQPSDAAYQARLAGALDKVSAAVKDHPGLAGVYFTISSMTNGYELHLRIDRRTLEDDPGDAVIRQGYLDVMDLYQERFEVPVVFEAGHCLWTSRNGGPEDCETPLALYRHSRDTYGVDHSGIALWNCAERFWATSDKEGEGVRPVLEEATADGASIGCQTVGSFSRGACRFTDDDVADYGETGAPGSGDDCPASETFNPEAACVDTMNWFTGTSMRSPGSVEIEGTWGEIWSRDITGIRVDSEACAEAMGRLSP